MAPKPQQYSAEELEELKATLTEEELEGMLDEDLIDDPEDEADDNDSPFADEPDDDAGTADDTTGDDDDEETGNDDGASGDDAGEANGGEDDPDAAAADPDDAGTPDADTDAVDPAAGDGDDELPEIDLPEPPKFEAREAPAELKARHAELERTLEELAEKHDEGEITTAEFTRESRKVQRELAPLDVKLASATVTAEDAEAQTKAHWVEKTVPAFLEHFPEYKASRRMLKVLDDVVREVQVDEATKDPLHPDVLRKAHRIIETEYGFKFAKSAKAAPAAEDPKPAGKTKRVAPGKNKPREIPPTLGRIPAAENEDTDTSRWAAIDRLKGVEYEEALARMSEADSDAYEAWLASR